MKEPCRCLHCGEVVMYDVELSSNLNHASGCKAHPSGLHACSKPIRQSQRDPAPPRRG